MKAGGGISEKKRGTSETRPKRKLKKKGEEGVTTSCNKKGPS